jgi:hypothetical protein
MIYPKGAQGTFFKSDQDLGQRKTGGDGMGSSNRFVATIYCLSIPGQQRGLLGASQREKVFEARIEK